MESMDTMEPMDPINIRWTSNGCAMDLMGSLDLMDPLRTMDPMNPMDAMNVQWI